MRYFIYLFAFVISSQCWASANLKCFLYESKTTKFRNFTLHLDEQPQFRDWYGSATNLKLAGQYYTVEAYLYTEYYLYNSTRPIDKLVGASLWLYKQSKKGVPGNTTTAKWAAESNMMFGDASHPKGIRPPANLMVVHRSNPHNFSELVQTTCLLE